MDRHLTQSDVREFLLKKYELLRDFPEGIEMEKLKALLVRMGWVGTEIAVEKDISYSKNEIGDAISWMEKLDGDHVITRGIMVAGAGVNLDILDAFDSEMDWVHIQAQRLLQHVESRRSKSLTSYTTEINDQQIFAEKSAVSVFFSRYARRHGDLRFINTAFKLNEWLMTDYRRIQGLDHQVRFLLALAEQENSAKELLA